MLLLLSLVPACFVDCPSVCCSGDDGYVRDMKDFVARGIQLTRCPTTQRLRMSIPDESQLTAAMAAAKAARSNGGAQPAAECPVGCGCGAMQQEEDFSTPSAYSYASSPSEIMSSINSINLAESIAKHKQWTAPPPPVAAGGKAAAAAAVTAVVGAQAYSSDGEEAQA